MTLMRQYLRNKTVFNCCLKQQNGMSNDYIVWWIWTSNTVNVFLSIAQTPLSLICRIMSSSRQDYHIDACLEDNREDH